MLCNSFFKQALFKKGYFNQKKNGDGNVVQSLFILTFLKSLSQPKKKFFYIIGSKKVFSWKKVIKKREKKCFSTHREIASLFQDPGTILFQSSYIQLLWQIKSILITISNKRMAYLFEWWRSINQCRITCKTKATNIS